MYKIIETKQKQKVNPNWQVPQVYNRCAKKHNIQQSAGNIRKTINSLP